ncbi:MAG: hypothetical protein R2716_04685 [Microthrixaceae bacterium]
MSPGPGRPGLTRTLRKWGPFSALMAAVVLLGVLVVVDDPAPAASPGREPGRPAEGVDADRIGAPAPVGRMPPTHAEASEAGTASDYDWGGTCDTDRGTVELPSVRAAPCVPAFEGDNGGATYPGVTGEAVRIVWYDASEAGGLDSLLSSAGLSDTPEQQFETILDWVELLSSVSETYGREVEVVRYVASGGLDDAVAAQSDAERIASEIEPFAVLGGPPSDGGAFAGELARNGIICLAARSACPSACSTSALQLGDRTGHLPVRGGAHRLDDAGEDNAGLEGTAEFAGDAELRSSQRRFGVVHFDQDPPVMTSCPDSRGWPEDFTVETYLLDFATMPRVGSEIMAKMKAAGVTTVIFAGDPLMPVYLTSAAEAIDYRPEWIFTGTVLTDTNAFGRMYDQAQMAHAFGVSQTGVPVAPEAGGALNLYRWYFGADSYPPARASYEVLLANLPRLFTGIQLAGPDLTPETFERPVPGAPSGGDPVSPQQSNGHWGFFENTDYNGTDDLAEIWWDVDAEGPDETGREGRGMWRYARGGAGSPPTSRPIRPPSNARGTVTRFEELPPELAPPDYPPPPGSPAASQ